MIMYIIYIEGKHTITIHNLYIYTSVKKNENILFFYKHYFPSHEEVRAKTRLHLFRQ